MITGQEGPKKIAREFGVTIGLILLITTGFLWLKNENLNIITMLFGVLFLIFGVVFPKILFPLSIVWLKIGWLLAQIVNPLILGFLYFVVITPYAFLLKKIGKKFLNLEVDDPANSYWRKTEQEPIDSQYLKKQY